MKPFSTGDFPSFTLRSPSNQISTEDQYDFFKIYACTNGRCVQLYKNMTGTSSAINSFCDIKRNADELRLVLELDATNNFYSSIDKLCWSWSTTSVAKQTDGNDCPEEIFTNTSGNTSLAFTATSTGRDSRMTWIFRPEGGAKSITVTLDTLSLPWDSTLTFYWDCDDADCNRKGEVPIFNVPSKLTFDNHGEEPQGGSYQEETGYHQETEFSEGPPDAHGTRRQEYSPGYTPSPGYPSGSSGGYPAGGEPSYNPAGATSSYGSHGEPTSPPTFSAECYDYSTNGPIAPSALKPGCNLYNGLLQKWYAINLPNHTHSMPRVSSSS
jgi:hypothetical protein